MTSLTLKRCPRCQMEYPADSDHFYRNGNGTLRARCIPCELQRKWEANQRRRLLKMERIAQRALETLYAEK